MAHRFKRGSIAGKILIYLLVTGELLLEFSNPVHVRNKFLFGRPDSFKNTYYRLKRLGLLEVLEDEDGTERVRLSALGEVEALILKMKTAERKAWDGKWRLVIFDIPEEAKQHRDRLRRLLVQNEFQKWQASVYISPWSLNREALDFLKDSGLDRYVRIARIDEMDNDQVFRKMFKL